MFQDTNKLVVFGSQLVGVLIVIIGLTTQQAKPRTPRPPTTKAGVPADSNEPGFFARLWDDPLEMPARQLATKKSPSPGPGTTSTSSASPTASPDPNNLVIWNILDASPVAEMRERRLRIRYAAVSAVLTANYLPVHESMLTRLIDKNSVVSTEKGPTEKLIGSFEAFVAPSDKNQTPPKSVTLVWTGKEVPLDAATIASITGQIPKPNEGGGGPEIKVLHHGGSEDLETFTEASKEWPHLETYFMQATIPTASLRNQPAPSPSERIITDDVLVDALVKELRMRIPELNEVSSTDDSPPRIVVIAESDTSYSRGIYQELENQFHAQCKRKVDLELFSYLRGLDGRSENVATIPEPSKQESYDAADLILQGSGIVEKSSGTSQFDYLRRLALRLRAGTKKWKGREVAAVGVLGSDIYDKILVLQAVRRALPSAIFFTTDLDAVYLEQDYQSVTRNLVVASADSLDVSNVPPMRDSYQTVLARKVLDLLLHPTLTSTPRPTPAVFEIALGRSIALDTSTDAGCFALRCLSHPWDRLIFVLALLNAFLVLRAVFTRDDSKENAPMSPWGHWIVTLEIIAASGGILYLVYRYVLGAEHEEWLGEPLALGVSIWPSIMIRLLAFLVAILLLRLASHSLIKKSKEVRENELKKLLFLSEQTPPPPVWDSVKHSCGSVLQTCRRIFGNAFHENATPPEQSFKTHLITFFGSNNPSKWWQNPRLRRLIEFSVIYFVISAGLFAIWPPSVPGRGAGALLIEKIVLALGVTLYMVHLIFCLDLHIGAFRFIQAFRHLYDHDPPPCWQETVRKSRIDETLMLEATSHLTEIIGKTLLYPLTVLILIILSRLRNFDNWVMTPSLTITFSAGAILLVTASLVLWVEGSGLKKTILAKHREAYEQGAWAPESNRKEGVPTPKKDPAIQDAAAAAQPDSNPMEGVPLREKDPAAPAQPESYPMEGASAGGKGAAVQDTPAAADSKEKREAAQKAFDKDQADLEGINEGVFAAWYNQPIFAALLSAAAVFGSITVASPLARLFLN